MRPIMPSVLTPEIAASAERISPAHRRFIEYASTDERCLTRAHFAALAEKHCAVATSVQPWPTLVQGATLEEMARASVGICRVIKKIPEYFFDFDAEAMSDYYHLHADFIRSFVLTAAGREVIKGAFGRGDFVMSLDRLWCVEFNMGTNVGGIWETVGWQQRMTAVPAIAAFLREQGLSARVRNTLALMMRHLVKHAVACLPSVGPALNVGYVITRQALDDATDISALQAHFQIEYTRALAREAPGTTGAFFMCGFADLRISDGVVRYRDQPIHILVEFTSGDVPTQVLRCFQRGEMTLHNGPVSYLLCNKLNLAILSEFGDCGLFSDEEQALIQRHVPWTRKLTTSDAEYEGETVHLPAFAREMREQLVLKRSISSSGHDVFVGANTSQDEWETALRTAVEQRDWIVQRYVPPLPSLYQDGDVGCGAHDVIWGLFVIDDEYAGAFLRMLPTRRGGIVNRSRGSLDGVVLEVAGGVVDDSYVSFKAEEC
jgi:hypothetical protein